MVIAYLSFSQLNSVECGKFVKYFCKKWFMNLLPFVYETEMLTQCQEDTGNRENL